MANWRAQPPVQMDIGPVLHADDVMAGKMDALYNRAAARDFLDVDHEDFVEYGVSLEQVAALRQRVEGWRVVLAGE